MKRIQKTLSILLIATGLALQIYMTLVEDELGAVPLIMIASGIIWYLWTRRQEN